MYFHSICSVFTKLTVIVFRDTKYQFTRKVNLLQFHSHLPWLVC